MNTSKIDKLRKLKNFTQNTFSDAIGISKQTYLNLLKSGDFRITHLEKMSEIFKIDICYFFKDQELKQSNNFEQKDFEQLKREIELLREVVEDKKEIALFVKEKLRKAEKTILKLEKSLKRFEDKEEKKSKKLKG